MAHLFKQMDVNDIDFEAMTIEKLIDIVVTEMVCRKIQQLEEATLSKKDETDGNQWTEFRTRFEVLTRKNGRYVMLNTLSNC